MYDCFSDDAVVEETVAVPEMINGTQRFALDVDTQIERRQAQSELGIEVTEADASVAKAKQMTGCSTVEKE